MTFDPITHTYREGDIVLPSVTQLLKAAGFIDTRWYKASGTNRGSAVHEATEALDLGEVELRDFSGQEIFPYLEAYEQFKADTGVVYAGIEVPVMHPSYQFAGTLDRDGKIGDEAFLIDIKTGTGKNFWHGLQLAAYESCLGKRHKRILFLKPNGKYSLVDRHKDILFADPMWADYWDSIAKKDFYDRAYFERT